MMKEDSDSGNRRRERKKMKTMRVKNNNNFVEQKRMKFFIDLVTLEPKERVKKIKIKKEGTKKYKKKLVDSIEIPEEGAEIVQEEEGKRFFGCYLLCSLCPRFKEHTYIGFTVNPCRRIRQHNGEIRCGAESTKLKRPWEMILCIYGFPTKVSALQFEWAWQNPTESLAVRDAAVGLKSLSGIVGKIMLAYTMLTLPPWMSLKLTVNFFSTKYMNNAASCPSLPKQMKVQICPMDELPCYTDGQMIYDMDDIDDAENGTNNNHLEGQGGIPVFNESDYHHSSVEGVDDVQKCNENNAIRQPGEDWPGDSLSSREANPLQEPWTVRGKDHKFLFDLVDSALGSSSTVTSLDDSVETIEEKDTLCMSEMGSNELGQVTEPRVAIPIASKEHLSLSDIGLLSSRFRILQPNELHTRREDHYEMQDPYVSNPVKTPIFSGFIETVEDNNPVILLSPDFKSPQTKEHSICHRRVQSSVSYTPLMTQFSSCSGLVKTVDTVQGNDYIGMTQDSSYLEVLPPNYCRKTSLFSDDNQPLKTQFSSCSGLVKTVDTVQDKDYCEMTQDSSYLEVLSPNYCRKTSLFSDNNQPPSSKRKVASPKVEVIDILTPSSNTMINLFRQKKRRNNWVSQDIIDLTK